jgi:hypothetical protein
MREQTRKQAVFGQISLINLITKREAPEIPLDKSFLGQRHFRKRRFF